MSLEFTARIKIDAIDDDADVRSLKYALAELLRRACACPPDRRFDWKTAQVIAGPPFQASGDNYHG